MTLTELTAADLKRIATLLRRKEKYERAIDRIDRQLCAFDSSAPTPSKKARKILLGQVRSLRVRRSEDQPLTAREQEILQVLGQGLRDKEIAERLGISPYTVYDHLKHIYRKLHARTRMEAVLKAWRIGPG